MAKLVYKGKIKGNDVVYKEGCINYYIQGGTKMNLMDVITETGKEFNFQCLYPHFIQEYLEGDKNYLHDDELNEVIIKEKGKPTLRYKSKKVSDFTAEGRRAKIFLEKANEMYNGIRREIFKELRAKPKDRALENVITNEQISEEVADAFNTDTKSYCLRLYKEDTKRFIKFFSKIDKNTKKGMLNEIFSCDYENKEAIDWLNKNEADLLREAGFNG